MPKIGDVVKLLEREKVTKKIQVGIQLDVAQVELMERISKKLNTKPSTLMRMILTAFLEEYSKEQGRKNDTEVTINADK